MADEIEILSPLAFKCLPTANAKVKVRYRMDVNKIKPPPTEAEITQLMQNNTRYKVWVKVGNDTPGEVYVPLATAWREEEVTFASRLTAAEDVMVTAKLIDTDPNPDKEMDDDAVAHVNVSALCPVKDPVIDDSKAAPAEEKVGVAPPPAPKGFLHRTVRCAYPVVPGSVEHVHRVVAVVTRVYTDPKNPKEVTREVWATADSILQAGVATAVLPLPTPTDDTKYEYHFMWMLNITNAVFFSTLPKVWPPV